MLSFVRLRILPQRKSRDLQQWCLLSTTSLYSTLQQRLLQSTPISITICTSLRNLVFSCNCCFCIESFLKTFCFARKLSFCCQYFLIPSSLLQRSFCSENLLNHPFKACWPVIYDYSVAVTTFESSTGSKLTTGNNFVTMAKPILSRTIDYWIRSTLLNLLCSESHHSIILREYWRRSKQ